MGGEYRTGNIYGRSEAMKRYIGTCLPHAGRYMQSRTGAVTQVSLLLQSFFCYCRITFFAIAASFFSYCRIIFFLLPHHFLQTAMKRSPHPAGRALRTQRKFVALAWSRVTPHPPALRVTRQHNIASTVDQTHHQMLKDRNPISCIHVTLVPGHAFDPRGWWRSHGRCGKLGF